MKGKIEKEISEKEEFGGEQLYCFSIRMIYSPHPKLHAHGLHEFYYCRAGTGEQWTEAKVVPMRRGDFFFFPAGQNHIGNGSPGRSVGLVLNLTERAFSPQSDGDAESLRLLHVLARRALAGDNRIPLSASARRTVCACLEDMIGEQRRKPPGYRAVLKARSQEFLAAIARGGRFREAMEPAARVDGRERLRDVFRHLSEHYAEPLSVARLAAMAHLGRSRFHELFRAAAGRTLSAHVQELRIVEAARLLRETDWPILEIAARCGFPCLSHFYHEFRRREGVTPRAVRLAASAPDR